MTFPDPPADWFGQRHRELLPQVREYLAQLEAARVQVAWQRHAKSAAKG